ncbi:MAG: ATP-binding protein [Bacteroidota bacterium]
MQTLEKSSDLIDQLLSFETFAKQERPALEWLVEKSEYYSLEEGEFIFQPGDPADYMVILMKGNFLVYLERDGQRREAGIFHAGYITGILPFSRMKEVSAHGVSQERCTILQLHKRYFTEMVNASYELTQALVGFMSSRIREFSQIRFQDEKLMALGKLSAGLAHELNNPASAMVRSSEELYKNIHTTPEKFKAVITMDITPEQTDQVNGVLFSKINNLNQSSLSILEREEKMDDLLDWLDDHEVEGADDIAETYLDFGLEVEELDKLADIVSEESLPTVLKWIESTLNLEKLVVEIRESADRIAELVKAVKGYSYMDRGKSLEPTDLHEGLKLTLMILKHKLKDRRIQVSNQFADDLPMVMSLGGQLNQVWTNLISNAVEAMEPGGTLSIKTYEARQKVWIEIKDTGSGIPEENLSRIFEPFFTTKPMGEGTGMGLDIVKKIINRHDGDITVRSVPGDTTFEVWFPVSA